MRLFFWRRKSSSCSGLSAEEVYRRLVAVLGPQKTVEEEFVGKGWPQAKYHAIQPDGSYSLILFDGFAEPPAIEKWKRESQEEAQELCAQGYRVNDLARSR